LPCAPIPQPSPFVAKYPHLILFFPASFSRDCQAPGFLLFIGVMAFTLRSLCSFGAVALALLGIPSARALVIYGGNGTNNTTDPNNGLPWGNVGTINGSSAVFLGNYGSGSWVITAAHVESVDAPGITLGNTFYAGVSGSGVRVLNADNSVSDLYMYRISGTPSLPTLSIATSRPAPSAIVTAVGYGKVEQTFKQWDVTINNGVANDVWTETAIPANVDYVGYTTTTSIGKRWGQTRYLNSGFSYNLSTGLTSSVITMFEPVSGSTLGVSGDSGGGVFYSTGGNTWALGGVYGALGLLNTPDTPPPGDAVATGVSALYNVNHVVDFVTYGSFINGVLAIPEPASWSALAGALALGFASTRRRR
jgi:hypothetical protein